MSVAAVAQKYFDALEVKQFDVVAGMFADDIVWHQPGDNRFSGTHRGSGAVNAMIGGMMEVSRGTFALSLRSAPMVNGDLVAAEVRFGGEKEDASMAQDGVDVMRVSGDQIVEVWLYSSDQKAEDAFWGPLA
ncbi:nuclear transport factor 2 family protein [Kibdelosporangium philippinense]|uniref:Nuclear transport factor 2 family protein n=1 Tax=Kibdelosporangium philippinense TaxID=211113 RepID=A0ABS8ZUK5_9PSEU|nr:nuclear transport factor 2 family protein [Kibdelosporangium philippinense]MCE7010301.1 nuclear transport factor 2 family protein [Kibdelosporangium philippinense]